TMADTRRTTGLIPWLLGLARTGRVQSTPGLQICQAERRKFSFKLPPYSCEVFLPALDPQRVYEITFEGVCRYAIDVGWIFTSYEKKAADALYLTDFMWDFREAHNWLTLDGIPVRQFFDDSVREGSPREDRELH